MSYDWRDALRRKLPRDPAFGALPLLARLFFLGLLDECDADGRLRVGAAAPADALAFMLGAHAGERRLIRGWFALYVEQGFLRAEGSFVCLKPLADGAAATNETNRTNETNFTSSIVTPRNSTGEPSKPSDAPAATNETNFTNIEPTPRNSTDDPSKPAATVEGSGGFPSPSLSSLPHSPSLTLPPTSPSDPAVRGESASATPSEPGPSMASVVAAAVTAGVAAALASKPAEADARPHRTPKADAARPLAGTPAASALEALEATQVLVGIVDRPASLALSITAGAYPAVDLRREIAAADGWLVANPANAKKNGARYLTGWLRRAQERAPRAIASLVSTEPSPADDANDPWAKGLAQLEAERRALKETARAS